ncbi:MAG: hypothetical protein ACD_67C00171G0001 [uncultured bacterium]|nr:MAG: hypothetical protein ACD_67C00171G0001 [uncultured bacterium]
MESHRFAVHPCSYIRHCRSRHTENHVRVQVRQKVLASRCHMFRRLLQKPQLSLSFLFFHFFPRLFARHQFPKQLRQHFQTHCGCMELSRQCMDISSSSLQGILSHSPQSLVHRSMPAHAEQSPESRTPDK